MPKATHTHIIAIIDASGSMGYCRDDAIGGFNTLVETQEEHAGVCTLTLTQFNSVVSHIYANQPLVDCEPRDRNNYITAGMTALLDGIGLTVNKELTRILALPEAKRPDLINVIIITDGQENASTKYTKSAVTELLDSVQDLGWQITYIGANQDSFSEARDLGVRGQTVSNYAATSRGTKELYKSASASLSRGRMSASAGESDEHIAESMSFSPEERSLMAQ